MAARTNGDISTPIFFKITFDRKLFANKDSLHYLMSVAKQMLATGHCYSGLVTVVIAATAIRMTVFFYIISIFCIKKAT